MKKAQTKNVIKFVNAIIILTILAILSYSLINQDIVNDQASSQIQTYGLYGIFVISFLLDLIPQMLSPAMILAAAIFTNINTTLAILATIIGSTLGSIIGFSLGKRYMFKAVDILTSKKSTKKLTLITNKYGKIIIPITAISPFPYLPVLFGAMNFSTRNFIIYGLIPRAIGIIIFGYLINLL